MDGQTDYTITCPSCKLADMQYERLPTGNDTDGVMLYLRVWKCPSCNFRELMDDALQGHLRWEA